MPSEEDTEAMPQRDKDLRMFPVQEKRMLGYLCSFVTLVAQQTTGKAFDGPQMTDMGLVKFRAAMTIWVNYIRDRQDMARPPRYLVYKRLTESMSLVETEVYLLRDVSDGNHPAAPMPKTLKLELEVDIYAHLGKLYKQQKKDDVAEKKHEKVPRKTALCFQSAPLAFPDPVPIQVKMGWTNRTLVTDSDRYLRVYDRGQVILLRNIPPGVKDAELHNLVSKLGISTATFWWPYAGNRHSCHIEAGHKEKAAIIMAGLNQVQLRGQTLYTEAVPVPRKRRDSAMTTLPAAATNNTPPAQVVGSVETTVTTSTATAPSSSAAVSNPVPSLDGITTSLADANLNSQSPAPAQVTGSTEATVPIPTVAVPSSSAAVSNPVPSLEDVTAPLADANINFQTLATRGGGNAVVQASASSASASAPGNRVEGSHSRPTYPTQWANEVLRYDEGVQEFYSTYQSGQLSDSLAQDASLRQAMVHRGKDGKLKFLCRQYPSPDPMNEHLDGKIFVAATYDTGDENKDREAPISTFELSELSVDAKGWHAWECPEYPTMRGDIDKDVRFVHKVVEKINHHAPEKDTEKLFKWQLSLLDSLETRSTWKPGKVLGKRPIAHLNASMSKVFKPTTEFPDQRSTTFFGYTPQYRRPEGCGLGWGDYDRFFDWQLHGHPIPKDQVRKDGWQRVRNAPFRFVSEDDDEDIFEVTAQIPEQDEPDEAMKYPSRTLWERLNGGNSEHLDSRSSEAAETSKQKRAL